MADERPRDDESDGLGRAAHAPDDHRQEGNDHAEVYAGTDP